MGIWPLGVVVPGTVSFLSNCESFSLHLCVTVFLWGFACLCLALSTSTEIFCLCVFSFIISINCEFSHSHANWERRWDKCQSMYNPPTSSDRSPD